METLKGECISKARVRKVDVLNWEDVELVGMRLHSNLDENPDRNRRRWIQREGNVNRSWVWKVPLEFSDRITVTGDKAQFPGPGHH
jgi:hypothetical protein